MSSLASVLLWLRVFADLLVLIFLFACPCRDALSDSNCECTSLFLSLNRLKMFLSLGPSLVNTVVLTGLLRRVGLSLFCLSLENTLAVCEGRVPLDAVTGLCLLFLGLFFLSHDSDSENCAYDFRCEFSPEDFLLRKVAPLALPREGSPAIKLGCESECHCRTPESQDEATSRGVVGVWPSRILLGLGPLLVVRLGPAARLILYVISRELKNMNAYSLCGSVDQNKRRCPKRFEDQEQVVVQH
ncbi:hypothetical protein Tco_0832271 [Tanacetum coccineum]